MCDRSRFWKGICQFLKTYFGYHFLKTLAFMGIFSLNKLKETGNDKNFDNAQFNAG